MAYTLTPAPGTISISGATITGVGTTFTAYKMGALIFVKDIGLVGQLASDPTNDLSATLVDAWAGAAVSAKAFEVYLQNDPATYAKRVRDLLNTLAVPKTGRNYIMDASSTTLGDPGAGKVRFDSLTSPTKAWISYTDADGGDATGDIAALDDVANAVSRASFSFRPTDGAQAQLYLNVTGAVVDHTAFAEVPVSKRSGTVPANLATLAMSGVPSGADGTNGIFSAIASQAEAIAGTDNTKGMTPLRVRQVLDGSPLSGSRNKLINGRFLVNQRTGVSGTIASGATAWVADRWKVTNGTDQTLSWSTATSQPYGRDRVENRIAFSFGTSPTSGNVTLYQAIEDVRTLAGRTVTASVYLLQNTPNVVPQVVLSQKFGSGGSTQVDVSANIGSSTPQQQAIAMALPSVASKTIGAGSQLLFSLNLPIRSNSGPVVLTSLSLVGGDATGEADCFAERDLQTEMSLCERYYWTSYNLGVPPGTVDSNGQLFITAQAACSYLGGGWTLPTTMRANPTVTGYSPTSGASGKAAVDGVDKTVSITGYTDGITAYLANQAVTANQFFTIHLAAEAEIF